MPVIAQDTQRFSNVVKYELFPEFRHCREVITYNGTAKDFAIGDLVAVDGTTPALATDVYGIVVQAASAPATTNTAVIVLARGAAGVTDVGLNLGALALADVKAQLLTKDIKVLTAV